MISPCGGDRKRSYPEVAASLNQPFLSFNDEKNEEPEQKKVKGGFQTMYVNDVMRM